MSLLDGFFAKPRKPSGRPANASPVPDALPNGRNSFVLLMAASKGGAGKSLISIHLATLAAQSGFRSLIIDTDIEGDQLSCIAWSKLRSDTCLKAIPAKLGQAPRAIEWARRQGFEFIVIDTAGRDLAAMHATMMVADIMVTPAQPSPLDLRATAPIRRLWRASDTPAALILNGVTGESGTRARFYMQRYGDIGHVLPAAVGRRVQYADAIGMGLGVTEYLPGGEGDMEMRRLLRAIFQRAERKALS
ncbi:ParA family protein [Devosia sp.]|uniref:ParA family protein n=1 Tax=Devosia sp. TaxID=1871048 RepID=UPI002FC58B7F